MDAELQKDISLIWPHLSQKSLDYLVPIHKGESRAGKEERDSAVFPNIKGSSPAHWGLLSPPGVCYSRVTST